MAVIAKKLSTKNTLVYDDSTHDLYLIDPNKRDPSSSENILQFAHRLSQTGQALRLNQTQVNRLNDATQHIAILG